MIELFDGRLHIAWGRREWELQAKTEGGYLHWSGPPFLTREEALRGLEAWRVYDFFTDVVAVNVRTGWRLNG
jgi:hypothetical protein